MDISKKDWALFREKLAGWQEVYMEKLLQECLTDPLLYRHDRRTSGLGTG